MTLVQQVKGPEDMGVSSVTFHPEQPDILCVTSLAGYAALFDTRANSQVVARFDGHEDAVNGGLFVGGAALLTASDDRTVRAWDLRVIGGGSCSGSSVPCMHVLRGFRDGVNTLAHGPEGSFTLVSACDDGLVHVHSLAEGSLWAPLDAFMAAAQTVNDVCVLPGPSAFYLTASEDGAVRIWNRNAPAAAAAAGAVTAPVITELAAMEDRLVHSFDDFEGAVNHAIVRPLDDGYCWLFASVGELVFSTTIDPVTGALGEENRAYGGHSDYVRGLAVVGPSTLLTVSDDKSAVTWDIVSGAPTAQQTLHSDMIMALGMSPHDPSRFATGCEDGSVRLWSLPLLPPNNA